MAGHLVSPLESRERAIAEIRLRRAASNAAIAAHDPAGVAELAEKDVCVTTSTGGTTVGREAMQKRFAEAFARKHNLVFVRTPVVVEASAHLPHVAETGRWTGRWTQDGSSIETEGAYMALWVRSDDAWLISSELFVALNYRAEAKSERPKKVARRRYKSQP